MTSRARDFPEPGSGERNASRVRLPEWELQAGQALMPEVVADYHPSDREARGIQRSFN